MALGDVYMKDIDGNLGSKAAPSVDKVSGFLFDISKQKTFFTSGAGAKVKDKLQGNVIALYSLKDAEEAGITPYTGTDDLLFGIPHYHLKHYFDIAGGVSNSPIYVMFADCGQNWDAVEQLQRAANGSINQMAVWTEQSLWKQTDPSANTYSINIVGDLNAKALKLSKENTPLSILLSANTAVISTNSDDLKKVQLSKIPSCKVDARYVSVFISQALDKSVSTMQLANEVSTPVGCVGAALGCTAAAEVQESIGWVSKFNVVTQFPDVEFGFGDVNKTGNKFNSTIFYSSVALAQLEDLDNKGYIFLRKYAGLDSGVFFSKDQTSSDKDYRTIARNRTLHKSRRAVRRALLPYVNSPLKVDPSSGKLSALTISNFSGVVGGVLGEMKTRGEISDYKVTINPDQNVLVNDTLIISYNIIPIGTANTIEVSEGLALTNK